MEVNAVIRKGIKEDVPAVLALIKELAVFEKAPDEVVVTEEELKADGFGDDNIFGLFVAETDGKVVGMALYYVKYSTWKGRCIFLEDIIVNSAYRGKGIGKKLFEEVVRVSKEAGVRRLEWQVLDWNEPAIKFYKKHRAALDDEWINGKLVYEQIQHFNFDKK